MTGSPNSSKSNSNTQICSRSTLNPEFLRAKRFAYHLVENGNSCASLRALAELGRSPYKCFGMLYTVDLAFNPVTECTMRRVLKTTAKRVLRAIDRASGRLQEALELQNFVVTGIPRSGTSLFCSVVSSARNCYCFNEVHSLSHLQLSLLLARLRLRRGAPVRNKFDPQGDIASDTNRSEVVEERRQVGTYGPDLILGSKHNIPYLNQLETLLKTGLRSFALVRNPYFTLLSWNSAEVARIPEARLASRDLEFRFSEVEFTGDDRVEKQAEIWNYYARTIWKNRPHFDVITYEELTDQTERTMEKVTRGLDLKFAEMPALENRNVRSRYDSPMTAQIKSAVSEFCPTRKKFGYD